MKPEDLPKQELPNNRVIRRRIAARTTGIHVFALPPELAALADDDDFLTKYQIPEQHQIRDQNGALMPMTRNEAWARADRRAAEIERMLLSGSSGKTAAFFSRNRQGLSAIIGRQTLVFSGFFHDYLEQMGEASHALSRRGTSVTPTSGIHLGPIFIALETATATGLTALGHFRRGAPMGDRTVVTDLVSTGAYEGASAYGAAKLGVLAGAKAMIATATLPIPGAHAAAFAAGFLGGAVAAITGKTLANQVRNIVVDNACGRIRRAGEGSDPGTEKVAR